MVRQINSTPRADGFHMPAEFAKHAGSWMLWPQRSDNWRMGAKPAQMAFIAVAQAIAQFEIVTIGVNPDQLNDARQILSPHIRVVEISNNDAWMRDCDPTFVINKKEGIRGIDWIFNAWGGQYNRLHIP